MYLSSSEPQCECRTNKSSGENIWLHMPIIKDVQKSCKEIFPVAEYAFTTIPTYPSGNIGFMVCCKDASRNVKKPLRTPKPCLRPASTIHSQLLKSLIPGYHLATNVPHRMEPCLRSTFTTRPQVQNLRARGFVQKKPIDYWLWRDTILSEISNSER